MITEFFKGAFALLTLVAIAFGLCVWNNHRLGTSLTMYRAGAAAGAIVGLGGFLLLHFQRDKAPDYLRQACGSYFEYRGLCFAFKTRCEDGVCFLDTYFQNRHERACMGRVIVVPALGFFLTRERMDAILIEIPAGPGAFGVVSIPAPLTKEIQGNTLTIEVGAKVDYPNGRGRTLRFRNGAFVGKASGLNAAYRTGFTLLAALGGHIAVSSPAKGQISLPRDVATELPEGVQTQVTTLWRLGDEPLSLANN